MKLFQHSLRISFGALLVLMLATACSGGGHNGSSDGGGSGTGGGGGGGTTGGDTATSCTQEFNPDMAAAGEDCTPSYNQACPDATSPTITNDSTVGACDGVTVTSGSVTANGLTSNYEVLTPDSAATADGSKALIIALHWSNGTAESMADHMRMSELAKARDVTVVLPTAPDAYPFRTWGNSVVAPVSPRADRVALIDALIAQVKGTAKADSNTPVIVVGVSGGAVLAYQYGCDHADSVAGIELVAAEIMPNDLSACQPSQPLATVQVQGTADPLGSYANTQTAFEALLANNGCSDADVKHAALPVPSGELIQGIDVAYADTCTSGKGNALVTVSGGGHSWPGLNRNFDILPIDLFGPVTKGFDATLQGYDLLNYLRQ